MRVALSTAACPSSLSPEDALECWGRLASGGISELALDGLWPGAYQAELLRLARRRRIACCELAHPLTSESNRPAASPLSADREERRAAAAQLVGSVVRAAEHEVSRLAVAPWVLPLTPEIQQLRWLFALERPLPQAALFEQRNVGVSRAVDRLCAALDPVLEVAARLGVEIALPGPAPWPHQVPRHEEILLFLEEFRGAPLSASFCTDWAHVASRLGTGDAFIRRVPAVRLADAAGLATGLPLGCGELCWDVVADAVASAALGVLTFGADVTAAEVQRSLAWLER